MAKPAAAKRTEAGVGPFSMTDEERDIAQFAAYVATLAPDSLWDVFSHLDEERYPRRREAVVREMARRRLFFVVPYTQRELRLRAFLGMSVFLAALAALLSVVGGFTLDISPYERLPFFTDLAAASVRTSPRWPCWRVSASFSCCASRRPDRPPTPAPSPMPAPRVASSPNFAPSGR